MTAFAPYQRPAWLDAHPSPFLGGTHRGCVTWVTDGDTCHVVLDVGLRQYPMQTIRLAGINAPEMGTEAGRAARAFLTALALGKPAIVRTIAADKYGGRYDGDVRVWDGTAWHDAAAALVAAGHAVPHAYA